MMALPPSGYHPVDFAIQLRSVFVRRICDARKQYFPRKRYKGNRHTGGIAVSGTFFSIMLLLSEF
jgi:hypothetical protein